MHCPRGRSQVATAELGMRHRSGRARLSPGGAARAGLSGVDLALGQTVLVRQFLIFILVLVGINVVLALVGSPMRISIIGSIVLSVVVGGIMRATSRPR